MPENRKTHPEPLEFDEPIRFRSANRTDEDELDMTPMVDVTFLLLIFFMVTAAFSLQKSIEVPPPDQKESAQQARTIEELEEDDDFVIVTIDRDDTIWVNGSVAPSEQDLLVKLRDASEGLEGSDSLGPSSLLVLANGDCRHETVVMALDAGNAVGMENVRLATSDEMDY
ncbi:MAG TPA: biopolymer transporter ExbD [Thermoguttaceae bacterium]|nr:biopolymer transporter ExbD [Thermoguttaceae bacterium]